MVNTLDLEEQIKTVESNYISKEEAAHVFYISSVDLAKDIYQYKVLGSNDDDNCEMKYHYFLSDDKKTKVGPKSVKNELELLFEDMQKTHKMVCNADKVYRAWLLVRKAYQMYLQELDKDLPDDDAKWNYFVEGRRCLGYIERQKDLAYERRKKNDQDVQVDGNKDGKKGCSH